MNHLFEGTEKKFELILTPVSTLDLRLLGDDFWKSVVRASQAEILSQISNSELDAYLLSESSLFVYSDRAIMITCGTTRLIEASQKLLDRVPKSEIQTFFFERKNENFPDLQPTSADDDFAKLKDMFPGTIRRFGDRASHHISMFLSEDYTHAPEEDTTLEILMNGVSSRSCKLFCYEEGKTIGDIRAVSGLDRVCGDGFEIDDYLFEPQGYSMNAIREDCYYTFHITPQEQGSYVSFESNVTFKQDSMKSTLDRILNFFEPKSFVALSFQKDLDVSEAIKETYESQKSESALIENGYQVHFYHFLRKSYV